MFVGMCKVERCSTASASDIENWTAIRALDHVHGCGHEGANRTRFSEFYRVDNGLTVRAAHRRDPVPVVIPGVTTEVLPARVK